MPEPAALVILRSVVQNPYTNASGISMTQYSAIYNNKKKTVEVWPFQDYSKSFKFNVKGNRIASGNRLIKMTDLRIPVLLIEDWYAII